MDKTRSTVSCRAPSENPAGEGGAKLLKFVFSFVYKNAPFCSGPPSGRFGRSEIASKAMGPDSTGDPFKDEVL